MNVDIFNEMLKKASYGKGVLKPCIDEIEALRQQLDAANTLIKKYREEMSQEQIGSRMEWQPIDTAPKDGAEILVLLHPEIAERTGYHMEICHYKRRPLFGETWTAQNYGFSTELAGATHWMPLPQTPIVTTEVSRGASPEGDGPGELDTLDGATQFQERINHNDVRYVRADRVEQLEAERDDLIADAMRYRWLMKDDKHNALMATLASLCATDDPIKPQMDAAIDTGIEISGTGSRSIEMSMIDA